MNYIKKFNEELYPYPKKFGTIPKIHKEKNINNSEESKESDEINLNKSWTFFVSNYSYNYTTVDTCWLGKINDNKYDSRFLKTFKLIKNDYQYQRVFNIEDRNGIVYHGDDDYNGRYVEYARVLNRQDGIELKNYLQKIGYDIPLDRLYKDVKIKYYREDND
jgi:hypothetical protein